MNYYREADKLLLAQAWPQRHRHFFDPDMDGFDVRYVPGGEHTDPFGRHGWEENYRMFYRHARPIGRPHVPNWEPVRVPRFPD